VANPALIHRRVGVLALALAGCGPHVPVERYYWNLRLVSKGHPLPNVIILVEFPTQHGDVTGPRTFPRTAITNNLGEARLEVARFAVGHRASVHEDNENYRLTFNKAGFQGKTIERNLRDFEARSGDRFELEDVIELAPEQR